MDVVNIGQELVVDDLGGNASDDGGDDEDEKGGEAPFHGLNERGREGREGGRI